MKNYNGEKAIISLTSWTQRIQTVGYTIYSILKQCPDYHIVLVLSLDEFPNNVQGLPSDIQCLVDKNLIEILWVKKNYKSYKKILFTMEKYPTVPIISADDDFIYNWNYADALYNQYIKHHTMVSCTASYKLGKTWPHGYAVLYPPNSLLNDNIDFRPILDTLIANNCFHDDGLLGRLYYRNPSNPMAISLNLPWTSVCSIHSNECIKNALSQNLTKDEANRQYAIMDHILSRHKYHTPNIELRQSRDLIIGNNCCGGNFYQLKHIYYNNPFIWMLLPYDSIAVLMTSFDKINWASIKLTNSPVKENTFILTIDNKVNIHFVHHMFNPLYDTPTLIRDSSGSHLVSNHIWEYIINKYSERVKQMLATDMTPKFIIHDQNWGMQNTSIDALARLQSPYKRVFVTTHNIASAYPKTTKIIHTPTRTEPEAMINNYFHQIDSFLFSSNIQ